MQICLEMEQPNSAIEMLWSGQSRVSKCRVPTHCLRKRGINVPRASKYLTCCEHKWNQRNPSCLHTFGKLFGMFVRFCALNRLLRILTSASLRKEETVFSSRYSSGPKSGQGPKHCQTIHVTILSTFWFVDLLTCSQVASGFRALGLEHSVFCCRTRNDTIPMCFRPVLQIWRLCKFCRSWTTFHLRLGAIPIHS